MVLSRFLFQLQEDFKQKIISKYKKSMEYNIILFKIRINHFILQYIE